MTTTPTTVQTRMARLTRTNHRLTLALVALGGLAVGAVLTGLAQPSPTPQTNPIVGLTMHDAKGYLYRIHADGSLVRLDLKRGRVIGGTPADWKPFGTGIDPSTISP